MESTINVNEVYGIKKNPYKKKGLALQLDGLGWFLLALAIVAIALVGLTGLLNTSKISSEQVELTELRDAVMEYKALRMDGTPPSTLEVLMADPCISAGNAIDGQDHGPLISPNKRWSSTGTMTDMWGTKYTYTTNTSGGGTITSTGSGKNISIDF